MKMNMNKTRDKTPNRRSSDIINRPSLTNSTPPQLIRAYILPTLSVEQLELPKQQPKMTVYHIGTLNLNLTLTLHHY